MYSPLVPCCSCARHVRTTEPACPFCAAPLVPDPAAAVASGAVPRLGRAATFVLGATLAVAACSSTTGGGDAGGDTAVDVMPDTVPVAPPYGAPPQDAGPDDEGGSGELYGAPPPPDGG